MIDLRFEPSSFACLYRGCCCRTISWPSARQQVFSTATAQSVGLGDDASRSLKNFEGPLPACFSAGCCDMNTTTKQPTRKEFFSGWIFVHACCLVFFSLDFRQGCRRRPSVRRVHIRPLSRRRRVVAAQPKQECGMWRMCGGGGGGTARERFDTRTPVRVRVFSCRGGFCIEFGEGREKILLPL